MRWKYVERIWMRIVSLKNASPYADATLNVAPWHLSVCGDQYSESELTKEQIFVRDIVDVASGITLRGKMYDYLRSQRSYPMREMQVKDPRLYHFVTSVLNPDVACRLGWDQLAHYAASLPFRFVKVLPHEELTKGREDRLVSHTLASMSVFPLKTVFKSYAILGLYFFQEFEPSLCTAFESPTPVPMACALSTLSKEHFGKRRFKLLAAAMMLASADGYMDAARQAKDDPVIQQSLARQALRSFGLVTVFSLSVRENAHCYSPTILDTLQRYAGYMQGSIKAWQTKA